MATASTSRGKRVAARRKARGLAQEDLAHLCGCSVRTIQRIEQNESASMSQRLIEALQEHLGVPIGELVNCKRTRRA